MNPVKGLRRLVKKRTFGIEIMKALLETFPYWWDEE